MTRPSDARDRAGAVEASGTSEDTVLLPASFAQELLFLTDRASPGSVAYNVPRTRRLLGPLDVDGLRRAFDALVQRHEILRTTYRLQGEQVVQAIHPATAVPFELIDLSAQETDAALLDAGRLVRERGARSFDLTRDLMLRVTLFRLAPRDHVLLFESHHIAFDGWSRDVVFRDLAALYQAEVTGMPAALPALPIQYADFAIWQREQLQGDRLDGLLAWWRDELADTEHQLQLPTDFPRPATPRYDGITETIDLPPAAREAIHHLGQQAGATPYMVVLAAYATVLHRYTAQPDILVGSPIAGRAQSETEALIGCFANTIVQRARFAGDPSFAQLLARLRESALGAYDHQDVPFEKLVLELEGKAAFGQSPLFQVVLTQLDLSEAPEGRMGDVTLTRFAHETGSTKFDLTLFMLDRPEGLRLVLRGRSDLFSPESVARMLGHIAEVLTSACRDASVPVSRLAMLSEAERQALSTWGDTAVDEGPAAIVVQLFEARAKRVPDRIAVVTSSGDGAAVGQVTYADLNRRSNQLAHHLRQLGVQHGDIVGLGLDRSIEAVIGLLGVLKAGAAYLPVPPGIPAARREEQLRDAGAKVLVTVEAEAHALSGEWQTVLLDRAATRLTDMPADDLPREATPDSLAYVLYTSGSTGVPKGVAVTRANVVHYVRAISRVLADVPRTTTGSGLDALEGRAFGMVSTLGADLGGTVLFTSLVSGGTLHLLDKATAAEPARFAEYVHRHPLDLLKITPGHLQALLAGRTGHELASVLPRQWIILGGEPLQPAFARALVSVGGLRVLNHYGPTETTIGVCTFEATPATLELAERLGAQTVPIGRPLANTRAWVVDRHGQEVPVGVPGELLLGGAGVAAGYMRHPELTASRFGVFGGERVYRSGDRVRRLPDGTIEFLGRADDQVKVRGFRVELGEIEQALRAHPGVEQAVAGLHHPSDGGDAVLVAHVVPRQSGYAVSHAERPTGEKLQQWLATALPDYMVPSAIVLLAAMPLTPNGKVDRRALPAPDAVAASRERAAPSTPTESSLLQIWAEALKRDPDTIGVSDDFLELGGHSLVAIRILGRISRTFGLRLPLRTLFDAPRIAQLAELIDLERKLALLDAMAGESAGADRPAGGEG